MSKFLGLNKIRKCSSSGGPIFMGLLAYFLGISACLGAQLVEAGSSMRSGLRSIHAQHTVSRSSTVICWINEDGGGGYWHIKIHTFSLSQKWHRGLRQKPSSHPWFLFPFLYMSNPSESVRPTMKINPKSDCFHFPFYQNPNLSPLQSSVLLERTLKLTTINNWI